MRLLPEVLSYKWTEYPRARMTANQLQRIKAALRFSNPAYFSAQQRGFPTKGIPPYLNAWRNDERDLICLPRNFRVDRFGLAAPIRAYPEVALRQSIPISWKGKPRKNQVQALLALEQQIANLRDGILSLSCGKGKTVLAIAAWARVTCGPALAVVPTLDIARQWVEALKSFTDISESRIGFIGNGRDDWRHRWFTISTLQTLAKKEFPQRFYERFGLIYFDEAHRLGAPFFSKVCPMFPGIRIGLSATVTRPDGMDALFRAHLGEIFFEDHSQDLKPKVFFEKSPMVLNLKGYRMWGNPHRLNFAKIYNKLSKSPERQSWIVDILLHFYKKSRKVLVLGERIAEFEALESFLVDRGVPTHDVGLCVGSLGGRHVGSDERRAALSARIVLATNQLAREGLDQADFDTLVILYPKSNPAFAEQAVGRILRVFPGKQSPLVVVVHDAYAKHQGNSPFTAMCKHMANTFRRLGYPVQGV